MLKTFILWIRIKPGTKVSQYYTLKKDRNPDFNTGRFWACEYPKPYSSAVNRSMNEYNLRQNAIAIPPDALAFIYDYCFCKMILLLSHLIIGTKVRPGYEAKKGQTVQFQYREIQRFSHIFIFKSCLYGF